MVSGSGFEAIIDLVQIIIKFMGRLAVQRQLLATLVALAAAAYLSKPLVTWLGKLYGQWLASQRKRIIETGLRSVTEDPSTRAALQKLRPLLQIAHVITYPLTAILLLGLMILLFNTLGWFSGLLSDIMGLLVLFLAYRLLIGICYVTFDKQRVIYYQVRFFRPLFVIIIFLLIINGITELRTLAQAPIYPLFDGLLTLGNLFLATVGLYLWIMAAYLFATILQSLLTNRTDADPRGVEAWLILLRYMLIVIAIVAAFQLIGFSPAALAAVLGGLSIGVGFAMQDVFRNFLGGIILLFEGSVRPGDWIEINNTIGKVEALRIRSTVVRTDDNVEYIVPNQHYLSSTIVAYTYSQTGLMLKIPVTVSHDANVEEIQELLINVAQNYPGVHPEPLPTATLIGFSANALKFELRVWILEIQNKEKIEANLRIMILEALKLQDIKVVT